MSKPEYGISREDMVKGRIEEYLRKRITLWESLPPYIRKEFGEPWHKRSLELHQVEGYAAQGDLFKVAKFLRADKQLLEQICTRFSKTFAAGELQELIAVVDSLLETFE